MPPITLNRPARSRPSLDPLYTRQEVTAALVAAAGGGGKWKSNLCFEGLETTDGREMAPGSLRARPGTLPLMALDRTTRGHQEARLAGAIEVIDRAEGGIIVGSGSFDDGEWGAEVERLVTPNEDGVQMLRWVSVDLEIIRWEYVLRGYDDDGWEQYLTRILEANIMGATVLPFPAFSRAIIVPEGADLATLSDAASTAGVELGAPAPTPLTIAASGAPGLPPAEWFANPNLPGPTHLRVEDDGRVFGHLADWQIPHIGVGNGDVYAPRSRTDYAYFATGTTRCAAGDDGSTVDIRTGVLSLGGGHADRSLGYRGAAQHYDDVCAGVADLASGEDEHGIWVAGSLRPGVTDEQIRILRASDISGDWRRVGGNLELVAILSVNVAGFQIGRSLAASGASAEIVDFAAAFARSESGEEEVTALVAAGMLRNDPVSNALMQLRRDVSAIQTTLAPLRELALERLAGGIAAEVP